jgi:hypothetical protein
MLLVGIGIGAAVGILISKPKIDKAQTEIDQLQTQMQLDKTNSEDTIQKAATEIARTKKELMQAKGLISKLMVQLSNAKTELSKFETQPSAATDTTEPETVVLGQPTKAPATPSNIVCRQRRGQPVGDRRERTGQRYPFQGNPGTERHDRGPTA